LLDFLSLPGSGGVNSTVIEKKKSYEGKEIERKKLRDEFVNDPRGINEHPVVYILGKS
jgi:hypothetical protein